MRDRASTPKTAVHAVKYVEEILNSKKRNVELPKAKSKCAKELYPLLLRDLGKATTRSERRAILCHCRNTLLSNIVG